MPPSDRYTPELNARRALAQAFGFDAYDEEDHGYTTPCWIYRKVPTAHGYAQMKMPSGVQPMAHRAFYERFIGPIPPGLTLDHLCEVKRCVNPGHLEPVTGTENVRRSSTAKLSMVQAREIRARVAGGEMQKALAAEYGVSRATVCEIWKGRQWAE